tara:strand:- start:36608 stop:37405 length:798 start_codon:yes stop_codon:yes gene_type:complete
MPNSIRSAIVRTLSLFFVIWSIFGPIDSSLIEFKTILFGPSLLNGISFLFFLKFCLIFSSIALVLQPRSLWLGLIQLIAGSLLLYVGLVSNSVWNYNTHIIVIALLTYITGLRGSEAGEKDLVTCVSLVFATIYIQAAISKVAVSGLDWMNTGLTIYRHLLKFNPTLSAILDGNPILFQMAGWLTVIGELVLGSFFAIPKTRKLAAMLSISFHIMLWFAFNISFWHLWIFYPALYFSQNRNSFLARLNIQDSICKSRMGLTSKQL